MRIFNKNILLIFYQLKNSSNFTFKQIDSTGTSDIAKWFKSKDYDAVLFIPMNNYYKNDSIGVIYANKIGIRSKEELKEQLQNIYEKMRFQSNGVDSIKLNHIQKEIKIHFKSFDGKDENSVKETISYVLGMVLGIMMYVILTIYGSQVMRGVMEEKVNRIAEVIISSVKPFELLMGKIIGIGMVSLLQFFLWGILIAIIQIAVSIYIGHTDMSQMIAQKASAADSISPIDIQSISQSLASFQFLPIILGFVFYFFCGYFLYSAMFAAVGSAVNDDPQDVQSLMMPVMMPIFFSFILLTKAINNPNSPEAVIGSILPFTAPVVMMSRIVFGVPDGVPLWQLILSMSLMIISIILFIWIASRIYRVGILMYGKKASFKELAKWIFYK